MEIERPSASYVVDVSGLRVLQIRAAWLKTNSLCFVLRCSPHWRAFTPPQTRFPCVIYISPLESRKNRSLWCDGPRRAGVC